MAGPDGSDLRTVPGPSHGTAILTTRATEGCAVPQFIMIYKGDATDTAEMSEDEQQAVMAKWGAWMEKVGPALRDIGSPFGPGRSIVDDGTTGTPMSASGYSIVEADDMDHATQLADGHPYLSEGKGDFAIDVFELMPVPM